MEEEEEEKEEEGDVAVYCLFNHKAINKVNETNKLLMSQSGLRNPH